MLVEGVLDIVSLLTASNWNSKHTRILLGVYRGKTDEEIALTVGLKAATVRGFRHQGYFQEKLQAMANQTVKESLAREIKNNVGGRARQTLEKAQIAAAKKVIWIMKKGGPQDKIKLEAAKDILDRTGLKAIEVIETRERSYTPEEVERAKQTLGEVENIIMRLDNKDSRFVLAKQTRLEPIQTPQSSSATDQGSSEAPIEATPTDPA